jgi:D-3-phosphoglycerate dehydrogenase
MKIVIVDKVHSFLREELEKNNFFVDDFQDINPDNLYKILSDYDGIVIRSKIKLTEDILQKCKNLKFIARVGAGMESIDIKVAEKLGIKLLNAPEGNRDSVGEQAVAMILSLFNNICRANYQVKNGIWEREPNRGIEIMGKTVGIIGYGNMGGAFARRLSGFGVKVISYDKYKKNYADKFTEEVDLQTIFNETDILSMHVPLTDETHYYINDDFIKKFSKNFYLLNTARGKVVNTHDLVKNLKTGKILGAALDVLEYEKVSFEQIALSGNEDIEFLKNANNVLLTPHIAGLTHDSNLKLAKVIAKKIIENFA